MNEEWISEPEDMTIEISKLNCNEKENTEKRKDRTFKNWDNFKRWGICIIGIPEREEGENGAEKLFELIIAQNRHQTMDSGSSETTSRINIKN